MLIVPARHHRPYRRPYYAKCDGALHAIKVLLRVLQCSSNSTHCLGLMDELRNPSIWKLRNGSCWSIWHSCLSGAARLQSKAWLSRTAWNGLSSNFLLLCGVHHGLNNCVFHNRGCGRGHFIPNDFDPFHAVMQYNYLNYYLPQYDELHKKLMRSAVIGFCSSFVSDTCSNSIRVIKTSRQTATEPMTYPQVIRVWHFMFSFPSLACPLWQVLALAPCLRVASRIHGHTLYLIELCALDSSLLVFST